MAIRLLFLFFGFFNFSSYSQDTLNTDTCLFYMPNTIMRDCERYGGQVLVFNLDCDLEDFEILIFNYWGEVIHESTDIDELWDPFTVLKETQVLTWQITGRVLRNSELEEVKWRGILYFLP